jgi:hypothetical protein
VVFPCGIRHCLAEDSRVASHDPGMGVDVAVLAVEDGGKQFGVLDAVAFALRAVERDARPMPETEVQRVGGRS